MEDNPQCQNCIYWSRNEFYPTDEGECRRNPPVFLPVETVRVIYGDDTELYNNGHWPITADDEWCGEFKPIHR